MLPSYYNIIKFFAEYFCGGLFITVVTVIFIFRLFFGNIEAYGFFARNHILSEFMIPFRFDHDHRITPVFEIKHEFICEREQMDSFYVGDRVNRFYKTKPKHDLRIRHIVRRPYENGGKQSKREYAYQKYDNVLQHDGDGEI